MAQQLPGSLADRLLGALASQPDVYPHNLDLLRERVLLIQADLGALRAASFLDDRLLSSQTQGAWFHLGQLLAIAIDRTATRPLHFIFHTGHVGSTLISRLLDDCEGVLSLREPMPLRSLADAYDSIDHVDSLVSRAQFDSLAALFLGLWSRGYPQTRSVIVKATSTVGRFAAPLLDRAPAAKAVYLNVRAQTYLSTLLAGENSLVDLRGHAAGRIRRLKKRVGDELVPLHAMSPGELAAMSWLSESFSQCDASRDLATRVLGIDFDSFLGAIPHGVEKILAHFALPQDQAILTKLEHSSTLTKYSKAPEHAYSVQLRAQTIANSMRNNAIEVGRGLAWLERMARGNAGVATVVSNIGI